MGKATGGQDARSRQERRRSVPEGVSDAGAGGYEQSGERIVENEEWLRSIIAASRDGILVEEDEHIVYVNRSYAEMFGYEDPAELMSRHISVVISPEDVERLMELGRRRARGERPTSVYEFRGLRKDGTTLPVEASVSASVTEGHPYITTMLRDISERKRVEEALRNSEQLLRHLMHNLPGGSLNVFDSDLRYLFAAGQGLAQTGLTSERLVGKTLADLFPAEAVGYVTPYYRRAFAGEALAFELEVSGRWYIVNAAPLEDSPHRVNAVIALAQDITGRKCAEAALRESEERFRAMIEQANVGIVRVDADVRLAAVNPAFCKIMGRAEDELRGAAVSDITHPDDYPLEERLGRQLAAGEIPGYSIEKRFLRADGQILWGNMSATFVHPTSGEPPYTLAIVEDISGRKRFEEELQRSNDELERKVEARTAELTLANARLRAESEERRRAEEERARLLRRLVFIQEDERRRIAREMHDQFGQNLTALRLKLAMLKASDDGPQRPLAQIEELETIARQLDRDVDFLVWELRPTMLDDLGLQAALVDYAQNWSRHFDIPVRTYVYGPEQDGLPVEAETVMYRIAQEALNNVAKHAQARHVEITLEYDEGEVSFMIRDDGVGFDPEATSAANRRGLGLAGMRERAALVGGSLEVESAPSAGVTIFVRVPMTDYEEGGASAVQRYDSEGGQ